MKVRAGLGLGAALLATNVSAATLTVFTTALGSFTDEWIEDLVGRGITAGCSASPPLYCPLNPITRGQMATFITITFNLLP